MNAFEYREREAREQEREERLARDHRFREPTDAEIALDLAERELVDELSDIIFDELMKQRKR